MPSPGEVVIVDFVGDATTKRRPALVVSSAVYHATRDDIIIGLLTSKLDEAVGPTDYGLQDWAAAGLVSPTAFRCYLRTQHRTAVYRVIGSLTPRDWQEVQARLRIGLAVT